MARKSKARPAAFTLNDNFLYLLAELELLVGSGDIDWSSASATVARQRLEKLVVRMFKLGGGS